MNPTPDVAEILAAHEASEAVRRSYGITRPLTDQGNAERLVDRFGSVLRFDHTRRAWRVWDGKRWGMDETGVVRHLAVLTVRAIYDEAAAADDQAERKTIATWAKQSESRRAIEAMVALAESNPSVATVATDYDRDPDRLNTESGVVDLRTGTLAPHDPALMHSLRAPVCFDPVLLELNERREPRYFDAAPTFFRFIKEAMSGRDDAIEYLRIWAGYCLTGHASEHKLLLHNGAGGNGKGVAGGVRAEIMGDYSGTSSSDLLLDGKRSAGQATPEIAALHGKRLVIVNEFDDAARLSEARFKWVVSGDRLTGRFLHANPFEFSPTHCIEVNTNHLPRVTTGGEAVWRRIVVMPWDFVVPEERRDTELPAKLREEFPGILAWMVEGAVQWFAWGLPPAPTVVRASAAYRTAQDRIGPFLEDRTQRAGEIHRSELYRAYVTWSERESERAMSSQAFYSALRERGYTETSARRFENISLRWEP